MTATRTLKSRAAHVYGELRSGIINGTHEPGTPLRLADLAATFGVSMSVVREALIRLAEQHLVTLTPNQGFRVAAVSHDDLVDLTELRVTLESLALRKSIDRGTVDWEAEVIAAHHVLERATLSARDTPGTTEEWSAAHTRFHHALGAACGNARLIGLIDNLRDGAEIYRQRSALAESSADRDVSGEHRELMELATARRADEAAASLERHLRLTTTLLLQSPDETRLR